MKQGVFSKNCKARFLVTKNPQKVYVVKVLYAYFLRNWGKYSGTEQYFTWKVYSSGSVLYTF